MLLQGGAPAAEFATTAAAAVDYAPYRLTGEAAQQDWVQHLELDGARVMAAEDAREPLKVLVLYGSLRKRSYSQLLAFEFGRWPPVCRMLLYLDHTVRLNQVHSD